MLRQYQNKDNALLIEFEILVDTDLGLWRYIKQNHYDDQVSNKKFLDLDETIARAALLNRHEQNPLTLITLLRNPDGLYQELMDRHELEILQCSDPYSLFGLMETINQEASSVKIDILCQNEIERAYIKAISNDLEVFVSPKDKIDPTQYSAIYMKYIKSFTEYPTMKGRYIYVANAGYNVEPEKYCINIEMGKLIEKDNVVKSIDLYTGIKYLNFPLKQAQKQIEEADEHESEDLLKHSQ